MTRDSARLANILLAPYGLESDETVHYEEDEGGHVEVWDGDELVDGAADGVTE